MPQIIIRDYRYGNHFPCGINGLFYDLPCDQPLVVEDLLYENLVSFDCVMRLMGQGKKGKGASKSGEGSTDELAPEGELPEAVADKLDDLLKEPVTIEPAIKEAQVISDIGVYKELGYKGTKGFPAPEPPGGGEDGKPKPGKPDTGLPDDPNFIGGEPGVKPPSIGDKPPDLGRDKPQAGGRGGVFGRDRNK